MEYKIHSYFCSPNKYREEYFFGNTVVKLISHGEKCADINFSVQGETTYEIKIETTDSPATVRKVLDLLCCSYTLVYGYNEYDSDDLADHIIPESEKDDYFWVGRPLYYVSSDDYWYYALLLAEKAYGNQKMINAITRYHSAHKIVNLHPMDLDPRNDPFQNEYLLSKQMNIANCILSCYAALEEIDLCIELKRGAGLLNEEKNGWNYDTYRTTVEKLTNSGIDPNMEIVWLYRGNTAQTNVDTAVKVMRTCEWSFGEIGDYYTTPVDALLIIKYLRNKAGAHNDDEKIGALSIYDAENAFYLSRTLLLIKFGIYKLMEKE